MLIECPECGRKVSDRAKSCPDCGFPVAEEVSAKREAERAAEIVKTRRQTDREVDCVKCEARGFYTSDDGLFGWCWICEHTGRVPLCRADDGYYAVAGKSVASFLAGEASPDGENVVFLGPEPPPAHRYPASGKRVTAEEEKE